MKKKNLVKISNISKEVLASMNTFESKEHKGVVFIPKSYLERWQKELFEIVKDEVSH